MSKTDAITWPQTAAAEPRDAALGHQQDLALIRRCLDGDQRAYETLYARHAAVIYRLSYGLLQHREDAEEVLQDSFEYAFRKLSRYDPQKAGFKTWLYQIAVSRCRNKRRRKLLPSFSLSQLFNQDIVDNETPTPAEVTVKGEQQQQVWQALTQLTPKLRETVLLRYYGGLAYAEIGLVLGIPAKTAESRMRLAHKALRQILSEPAPE